MSSAKEFPMQRPGHLELSNSFKKVCNPLSLSTFQSILEAHFSLKQEISKIGIRKSTHQCFLPREFVHDITYKLDLQFILNLFNNKRVGNK